MTATEGTSLLFTHYIVLPPVLPCRMQVHLP